MPMVAIDGDVRLNSGFFALDLAAAFLYNVGDQCRPHLDESGLNGVQVC